MAIFTSATNYTIKRDTLNTYCKADSSWNKFLTETKAGSSWGTGSDNVDLGECFVLATGSSTSGIISPYDTDTTVAFNKTNLKLNDKDLRILNPNSRTYLDIAKSGSNASVRYTFLGNTSWKASLPYYQIAGKDMRGILPGGRFEGKLFTSLYASSYFTSGRGSYGRDNYLDYNKYKVVRNKEYLAVYQYDISRTGSTVNWVWDSDNGRYKITENNPYTLNTSPKRILYKGSFANGVVPMQMLLLISGCGGSGAYKTVWSDSAGGGAGSFVMAWLDWNKIPTDYFGNKTFWIRVPHGAQYSERRYNLSTYLNCYNEYSVDPVITSNNTLYADSCNNASGSSSSWYPSSTSFAYGLTVFSGTNACYDGTGGVSQAVILSGGTATSDRSDVETAEQNTHSSGYKTPFDVILAGRGGAAGGGAYYLYKYGLFSQDKKITPTTLDLRSLSTSAIKSLKAGTGGSLHGGASWFANGPAVNNSARTDGTEDWGCGAGGKNTNTGWGLVGGSGVVQIFY